MTPSEALTLATTALRRGSCSAHKLAAEGCATCEASERAIAVLRRLPVIPTCGVCEHCKPDVAGDVYCEDSPHDVLDPRVVAQDEPPAWCPYRGAP